MTFFGTGRSFNNKSQFIENASGILVTERSILGLGLNEFPSEVSLEGLVYFYTKMEYGGPEAHIIGVWYETRGGRRILILNK